MRTRKQRELLFDNLTSYGRRAMTVLDPYGIFMHFQRDERGLASSDWRDTTPIDSQTKKDVNYEETKYDADDEYSFNSNDIQFNVNNGNTTHYDIEIEDEEPAPEPDDYLNKKRERDYTVDAEDVRKYYREQFNETRVYDTDDEYDFTDPQFTFTKKVKKTVRRYVKSKIAELGLAYVEMSYT